jgi:hypothetical protein
MSRKLGLQASECIEPLGRGLYDIQPCDFDIVKDIRRFLITKSTWTNVFATLVDLQVEATMDAVLAVLAAGDPQNVLYTTRIYDVTKAAGTPNKVESNTGVKRVASYENSIMTIIWAGLEPNVENELGYSLRGNQIGLQFFGVTKKNEFVYRALSETSPPLPIPIELATFQDKNSNGKNEIEGNTAEFEILSENCFNWYKVPMTYSLLTKIQA